MAREADNVQAHSSWYATDIKQRPPFAKPDAPKRSDAEDGSEDYEARKHPGRRHVGEEAQVSQQHGGKDHQCRDQHE